MEGEEKGVITPMKEPQPPGVLLIAAECAPFAKTGGLADVAGALAWELKRMGHDVRLMLPFHRAAKEKYRNDTRHIASFSVELGWCTQYTGVELFDWEGIPCYFIDNEYYFGREIYKGGQVEGEQYAYFTAAALEALPLIGFIPGILHANDWHTALMPMLLKTQLAEGPLKDVKTVMTIHNLGYQGKFDFNFISDLLNIDGKYNHPDYMEHYGSANFLKAGIVFADALTTVSPSYAEEIKTDFYGEGLNGVLAARKKGITGILNGINVREFDPSADAHIPYAYDGGTLKGKQQCKEALLAETGLATGPAAPLIGMVTRLTAQKGLDLVQHVFDELMQENAGFILLGSGDAHYENFFRSAAERYPGKVFAYIGYNESLAHRIYAGSDFFLMPSMFEPCGISQMIALRYGALPIVRATGGLKDTVTPYNRYTGEGNGFSFEHFNAHDMLNTVKYAFNVYADADALAMLRQRAMAGDYSFEASAAAYAALYKSLLPAPQEREDAAPD